MLQRILLLAIVVFLYAHAVPQSSIAVDWSQVPANPTRRDLNATIGRCICNQHAVGCDPNCCCDPSCTVAMKTNSFTTCAKETSSWRTFVRCYERNDATRVEYTTQSEFSDSRVPGEDGVCIQYDNFNNDIALTFFVPLELTSSQIETPVTPDWFEAPEHTNFKAGDRVPIVYAQFIGTELRTITRNTGFMNIPVPGTNAECTNDQQVEFMKPIDRSQCTTSGTIESLCQKGSSEDYLYVGLTPPGHNLLDTSSLIPMYANFYNADTREYIGTINPSPRFASGRRQGAIEDSGSRRQSATSLDRSDSTSLVCRDFVVAAATTIEYDFENTDTGRIVNASVDLFVRDIRGSPNQHFSVDREFVVFFKNSLAATRPSLRSGTPGYVGGQLVNAGTLVDNGELSAIRQRLFGFAIPHGKRCSDRKTRQVKFLHDVADAGCGLQLTEAELRDICVSSTGTIDALQALLQEDSIIQSPVVPTNVSGIVDRIGRTADADPNNIQDWVPVRGIPLSATNAAPYNNIKRRCEGIIVGLHYVFSVGRAGIEYNAQDIIAGAKVEPIVGSWGFRNDTNPQGTTTVHFRFKVSFARYNDVTRERRVVPPPILPAVDDDVFYPFKYPEARSEDF